MKVGFIFGKKDKEVYDPVIYGNEHLKDIFSYNEQRQGFQGSFDPPNKIVYKKTLIKYMGEYKYFYIYAGTQANDIKSVIG